MPVVLATRELALTQRARGTSKYSAERLGGRALTVRLVPPRSAAKPSARENRNGGSDMCGETGSRPVYKRDRRTGRSPALSGIRCRSSVPSTFAAGRRESRSLGCRELAKAEAEVCMRRPRELSRSFHKSERYLDWQGHNLDNSCWSKKIFFSLEGAHTSRAPITDQKDCPRGAKRHLPIRKDWPRRRCSRPDRASSTPNDSVHRYRPEDCDAAA